MVVGRQKLLSLAVLSGLGIDAVRGFYHVPQNVTVSNNPEAHGQSTAVDADETIISLSSVGSTVEVMSASLTIDAAGTETLEAGFVNPLQPTTQDVVTASKATTSIPHISTASTEFDPSSLAPSEAVSSTVTVIEISNLSATDPSEAEKTFGLTSDHSSFIREESIITASPSFTSSDLTTSSSSLAWNYAPVGKESQSLGQDDPLPTEGPIGGEIVNLPPDIPPWADQTLIDGGDVTLSQPPINLPPDIPPWVEQSTIDGGDATLGQPSVSIPVSWDYVPATTTSDTISTRGQFTSGGGWNQTTVSFFNQSSTRTFGYANTTTTFSSKTVSYCQPSDLTATVTSWEIVHISTITWIGDPSNYTQPYPTLIPPPVETFPPCIDLVTKTQPPGITLTTCFTITASGGSEIPTCTLTVSTNSWGYGPQTSTSIRFAPTVTYITTDKNPAVMYSPIQTPDYGVTNDFTNPPRPTAGAFDPVDPPVYNTFHSTKNSPGEVTKSALKPVTVIVKPTEVIIGTSTIADNPTTKTQTVVVGGEIFTVGPTRVVGGGVTVTRPSSTNKGGKSGGGAGGGGAGVIYAPKPTSTKLNDLPIIISSSVAVIGTSSSTFILPPTPTTVIIDDHTVSLGPNGIAIIDPKGNPVIATVTIPPPPPGDQIITIGPGSGSGPNNNNGQPTKTTTVDGISITIISSSIAIIGVGPSSSTTLTFPAPGSSPTAITIVDNPNPNGNGSSSQKQHTLTLGPSGITITAPLPPSAIATGAITTIQALSIPLPSAQPSPASSPPITEVIVAGGSLLTAIGQSVVVIYGTTITYATLSSPLTTVIDEDETVVLDPKTGVIVTHNQPGASPSGPATVMTMGGPNADPSATEYAFIGGATITKVGASVVVVEGVAYTVGPSATTLTTVLGSSGEGQTVIIGPEGVVVGRPGGTITTIEYPFDDGREGSSTTVIFPGAEPAKATATATGTAGGGGDGSIKDGNGKDDEDEDAGVAIKMMWRVMMLGLGVAGTVGVFGL